MKKIKFFLLIAFFVVSLMAQEEKKSFEIKFSGYIKTDHFFDSRQTVNLREGHNALYPANELLDNNNEDINAKSSFNILSVQTRLTASIAGPDAIGAKTSGVVEGDFFGTSDSEVNGFRLRLAFVKLDWDNTSLIVGQYWHPMLPMEVYPSVVSFNTGAPLQPFSRNPMLRITQSFGKLKLILAAIAQRDVSSNGPDGFSSKYLRNSVLPNLHLQFQYNLNENIFGAGIDYKKITPRIVTTKNFKTDETISGISAIAYMKLNFTPFVIKAEGIYGENLADLLMLGGYAAKSIDTTTGIEKYTTINALTFWGEITYGKDLEFGLFGGYSKNLGAKENLIGTYYSRGNNIESLLRISPRVKYNTGKLRLALECEYTAANYGQPNNLNKGKVEKFKYISNTRILMAVYYYF